MEYGTSGEDKPSYTRPPKPNEHNPSSEQQGPNGQETIASKRQHQLPGVVTKPESSCSGSEGLAPMDIEMEIKDEDKTPAFPAPIDTPATSMGVPPISTAHEASRGLKTMDCDCDGAGGVLRVSMRLNNEMPEFVVATSRYDKAVRAEWRSEIHIQMASTEEKGMFGFYVFMYCKL